MLIIEDLWILIKEFLLDYKTTHKYRLTPCLDYFQGLYGEIFFRWSTHLPRANTNDIINYEYMTLIERVPPPHLELTTITTNKYNMGFIGGYGWSRRGMGEYEWTRRDLYV